MSAKHPRAMITATTTGVESLNLEETAPKAYIPPHKRTIHDISRRRNIDDIPSYTPLDVPPLGSSFSANLQNVAKDSSRDRSGRDPNGRVPGNNSNNNNSKGTRDSGFLPETDLKARHDGKPRWAQEFKPKARKPQSVSAPLVITISPTSQYQFNKPSRTTQSRLSATAGTFKPFPEPPLALDPLKSRLPIRPRTPTKKPITALPPPRPSGAYLTLAHTPPAQLSSPQPLLLILDLNGTLLARKKKTATYNPRPHLSDFLTHCLANYQILIWSSAMPTNVRSLCDRLFTPQQISRLVGIWGRDTLGLSPQEYGEKVQVYKRLRSVWGNEAVQKSCPGYVEGARWGQHNTVLVDDSEVKAQGEPWNLVNVPEFEWVAELKRDGSKKRGKGKKGGKRAGEEGEGKNVVEVVEVDVLAQVVGWLEEARRWSDVSAFSGAMGRKFAVDAGWTWKWSGMNVEVSSRVESIEASNEETIEVSDDEGGVKLTTGWN